MQIRPDNPLIIQGGGKVLLEARHPRAEEARDFLGRFAELEASPELLHTYKIHPLSLWNAASAGMGVQEIVDGLRKWSKFDVPADVLQTVQDTVERYGCLRLLPHPTEPGRLLRLEFQTGYIQKLVTGAPALRELLVEDGKRTWAVAPGHRGIFKQRALQSGWPVEDLAGFHEGAPLGLELRPTLASNDKPFAPRDYQWEAARRWWQDGRPSGGCGVVVLACGATARRPPDWWRG
jgi:DNA excision repair protein ERCC-3